MKPEIQQILSYLQQKFISANRIVILGIGSELCHDDGAGGYFIKTLQKQHLGSKFLLINGASAPENFTGEIKQFQPDLLIVVDAAFLDLPPGSLQLISAKNIASLSFSTHMLPLPVILSYIETETGCESLIIGIQPANIEQGFGISTAVQHGIQLLADIFSQAALHTK